MAQERAAVCWKACDRVCRWCCALVCSCGGFTHPPTRSSASSPDSCFSLSARCSQICK